MLEFGAKEMVTRAETLELVLLETGNTSLAVRATSVKRLQRIGSADLRLAGRGIHSALCGYLYTASLPVFDMADLLGLGHTPPANEYQLLVTEYGNRRAGFVVEQAQEVLRAGFNELDVLPPVVARARLRPAAWALWRKSPEELIVLIEPTECFTAEEWQHVLDKGLE